VGTLLLLLPLLVPALLPPPPLLLLPPAVPADEPAASLPSISRLVFYRSARQRCNPQYQHSALPTQISQADRSPGFTFAAALVAVAAPAAAAERAARPVGSSAEARCGGWPEVPAAAKPCPLRSRTVAGIDCTCSAARWSRASEGSSSSAKAFLSASTHSVRAANKQYTRDEEGPCSSNAGQLARRGVRTSCGAAAARDDWQLECGINARVRPRSCSRDAAGKGTKFARAQSTKRAHTCHLEIERVVYGSGQALQDTQRRHAAAAHTLLRGSIHLRGYSAAQGRTRHVEPNVKKWTRSEVDEKVKREDSGIQIVRHRISCAIDVPLMHQFAGRVARVECNAALPLDRGSCRDGPRTRGSRRHQFGQRPGDQLASQRLQRAPVRDEKPKRILQSAAQRESTQQPSALHTGWPQYSEDSAARARR
jgi:hypothetical protein